MIFFLSVPFSSLIFKTNKSYAYEYQEIKRISASSGNDASINGFVVPMISSDGGYVVFGELIKDSMLSKNHSAEIFTYDNRSQTLSNSFSAGYHYLNTGSLPRLPYMHDNGLITDRLIFKNYYGSYFVVDYGEGKFRNCHTENVPEYNTKYNSNYLSIINADYDADTQSIFEKPRPMRFDFCLGETYVQVFYKYNGLGYTKLSWGDFSLNSLIVDSAPGSIIYNTEAIQWNMNYPEWGADYPLVWSGGYLGVSAVNGGVVADINDDFVESYEYNVNGLDVSSREDSSDGRFSVFASASGDLVPNDLNGQSDIFLRDNISSEILRISVGFLGVESNGGSYNPVISSNGQYISFDSLASNLVDSDTNFLRDVFLVRNPLFNDNNFLTHSPTIPTNLRQASEGMNLAVGSNASPGSFMIEARIEDPDGGEVFMRYDLRCLDDSSVHIYGDTARGLSGDVFSVALNDLEGCRYVWKVQGVDSYNNTSEWLEFGQNSPEEPDFIFPGSFSFVHITDVHIGSNKAFLASLKNQNWYESQSYPRFTDVLYEIETKVNPRPDFILVGGDNVEYNDMVWLRDFRNIVDDFSRRTGIEIYVVPGNHDRYDSESSGFNFEESDLSGGNDYLYNYFEVMGGSYGVISFFEDNFDIMNDMQSREKGLNKYNYYFYHKGMQVIGLDSGEDINTWDLSPEGSGLNSFILNGSEVFFREDDFSSRIIFMHHPTFDGEEDYGSFADIEDKDYTDTGEVAQNNGFVNNWRNFINYCNNNNVQLVLSGHTHQNKIFDKNGSEISLSNWNGEYPLYIQTQSATKDGDDDHGYRVIDVIDGKAIPREAETNIKKYEKVVADLDNGDGLQFDMYDTRGNLISPDSDNITTSFSTFASSKKIIYNETDFSRIKINNANNSYGEYDLSLQKRNEGVELTGNKDTFSVYGIDNPELCKNNLLCASFLAINHNTEGKINVLDFFGMDIDKGVEHSFIVDWNNLRPYDEYLVNGLQLIVNGNYSTSYKKKNWYHRIDLNSPGELRVYDKNGNVTGLVDGEVKSDIPYSFYVPETETVYVFGDSEAEISDGIKTRIVGLYEATYDLEMSINNNDEEKLRVFADDILTNGKTTHQFSVDWEVLSGGGRGVFMQFDKNDDGDFEESFSYGHMISNNFVVANAGGVYEGVEGMEIILDGSKSMSMNGEIISYEWDFDNNGIYDMSSVLPTISHLYGDDYVGKISLRVTDDMGIEAVDSSDIVIRNTNPLVQIKKIESPSLSEGFSFDVSFSDSGWLDVHTASVDWGDGSIQNVSIDENNLSPETYGKTSISHKYRPIKDHTIKLTVIDDDGGTGSAQFTIQSPKQLKIESLAKLKPIETDNKLIRKELDKAIKNLENSLNKKYWDDDFHLNSKYGYKMFSEEKQAMQSLIKILKVKELSVDSDIRKDVRGVVTQLVQSDTLLLQVIISEKDIKVKNPIFQKIIDSGLNAFRGKIEKNVQNTDYYISEQAFDGFNGLWDSVRAMDFSRLVR